MYEEKKKIIILSELLGNETFGSSIAWQTVQAFKSEYFVS